jgi:hypothetical protein
MIGLLPYLGSGALTLFRTGLPALLRNAGKKTGRKVVGSTTTKGPDIDYSYAGRSTIGRGIPTGEPTKGLLSRITPSRKTLGILGTGAAVGGMMGGDDDTVAAPPPVNIRPQVDATPASPRFEQVLFPGISGQATNKELINAAILRGSLELLKPKQAGENFASQASRALEAGLDVNKTTTGVYSTAQEALQAAEAAGFKNIKVYAKGNGFGYTGTVGGTDINDLVKTILEGEDVDGGETLSGEVPLLTTKEEYDNLPSGGKYKTPETGNTVQTKP